MVFFKYHYSNVTPELFNKIVFQKNIIETKVPLMCIPGEPAALVASVLANGVIQTWLLPSQMDGSAAGFLATEEQLIEILHQK